MEKLAKKVSSRSGNVKAFSTASTYDDVFGGPPKYSTLSPRVEDYSEIFGGFHGSSIPVLEVPEADVEDADVFFDVTRSFDYSEVFRSLGGGGGGDDDFAFCSYHDLFVRLQSNGREYGSSDEAWTPAETESLSGDSVTSPHSAHSKSLSNGVSQQSFDNPRQFNLSFHRANPSEEDIKTEVHIAQLHAVPGYSFLVDECSPFQHTLFEGTHCPGADDMNLRKHATEGINRDKNLRKSVSPPQDNSFATHELGNGDQREREICHNDSHSNKAFVSISDISLRTHPSDLPPPSRPPPPFNVRNGYSGELPTNFRTRNHEFGWTSDDDSPPVYDLEIDADSSAFASAAAMKETMEKAQSKLRSVKGIMERKEGFGLPSRVKLGIKNMRVNEGKKNRSHDGLSDMNLDKVFVALDIDERKIGAFVGEKRKEVQSPINLTSSIMEGDKFIFVTEETSMKSDSKETWLEEPCSVDEAGEWKQATEFFELVKRDRSALGNQEKIHVQNDEVREHDLESRAYSEALKYREENCMKKNAAREAYVGDDQKKLKQAEETRGHVGNKKKENAGQEVSRQIGREKTSRKLRKDKEISQKLSSVDEWKEHDIMIEVLEDDHNLDALQQRKNEKRYKKTSEKGEEEKKTNECVDIAENVMRLVHPHLKEKSEKKTKATSELVGMEEASCEKKESQSYLKDVPAKRNQRMSHQRETQEACEPVEIWNKQKASLEIHESERQLQEAREMAEIERQHWGACEREESDRKITEAHEWAETQKKQNAVCEAKERERQSKASHEQAETEKNQNAASDREKTERRMKETCEKEEIETRLKLAQEETEKHLKQCLERAEIEKSQNAAPDECKKHLKESWGHEEIIKREKTVGLEDEKRFREAREMEEKEKCLEEVLAQKELMLNGSLGSNENEKVLTEASEKEEIEMSEKEVKENGQKREAYERNGVDKRSKRVYLHGESNVKLKVADEIGERKEEMENLVEQEELPEKSKQASKHNGSEKHTIQGEEQSELQKASVIKSTDETNSESSLAQEVYVDVEAERIKQSEEMSKVDLRKEVSAQTASKVEGTSTFSSDKDNIETETELNGVKKVADSFKMEKGEAANIFLSPATAQPDSKNQDFHIRKENVTNLYTQTRMKSGDVAVGTSNKLNASEMASECEDVEGPATNTKAEVSHLGERENIVEQPKNSSDQETNDMTAKPPKMVNGEVEKERRFLSSQTSEGNGEGQKEASAVKSNPNSERGNKNVNGEIRSEERKPEERLKKESELEKERQRKMEEEREREREREKDRMATYEVRERGYVDAHERAERAAIERATAEARQRALAEARERLERACAEAREKTFTDKQSIDAKIRAERAAVERATTEARERAFEKTMSGKFFSDSSNRVSSNAKNSEIVEGESAQRCKARLERHQRTAERAAKALAEKNKRDLLAQREQAEKNRLAESLGADVKRWSSGKEGNLRALLSTLQYILGPDSGWQPIPLTDVITSAAVKKAYRKATLCVHPDKLQQRGASIQQKYICEKVFDLLKEAWNKFNSEER